MRNYEKGYVDGYKESQSEKRNSRDVNVLLREFAEFANDRADKIKEQAAEIDARIKKEQKMDYTIHKQNEEISDLKAERLSLSQTITDLSLKLISCNAENERLKKFESEMDKYVFLANVVDGFIGLMPEHKLFETIRQDVLRALAAVKGTE